MINLFVQSTPRSLDEPRSHILASPGFMSGLCFLLLNDFILKQQFHNGLTGKLSDFAGLFIFPLFLTAIFPRLKVSLYVFTAIAFIFWKSPYAQPLIDYWNQLPLPSIKRTVDYSDLVALLVLPLFYGLSCSRISKQPALIYSIAIVSLFAFTATSYSKKTDYDNQYYFALTKQEIRERMSRLPSNEVNPQFWKTDQFEVSFDDCIGRAFIRVEEKQNQSVIKLRMIDYRCPSPPDKQEMLEFFEQEFIAKLREEPVTGSSKVQYIWSTMPTE